MSLPGSLLSFGAGALLGVGIATAATSVRHRLSSPDNTPVPVTAIPSAVVPKAHVSGLVPVSTGDVLHRLAYSTAYDRRLRHPAWTLEHLTPQSLARAPLGPADGAGKVDRARSVFTEDEAVPVPFRARSQDYFQSGYDRGHMVPAADAKSSQLAMDQTFLLTNIAPQVGRGFNRDYWAYFETWVRSLAFTEKNVYVFTVPLYLPTQDPLTKKWHVRYEVIGKAPGPNVSVPTHFSKVILTSSDHPPRPTSTTAIAAFVLPNAIIPDEVPLTSFQVPIETVEHASGLSLFSPALKATARPLCQTVTCQTIIRKFDQAGKLLSGPAIPSILPPPLLPSLK